MKKQSKLALGLGLVALLGFFSCSKDEAEPDVLGVKSVAITNAGQDGTTRVEGTLSGDTFTVEVPALSDLTNLQMEIVPEKGSTTTPATGEKADFTQNNGEVVVIASLGAQTKTYKVKVTKAAMKDEVALVGFDITGVSSPSYTVSHVNKTIVLKFTNVLGTTAVLSNIKANPAGATVTGNPAISDKGEMKLDFSSNAAKTITVAMGSKSITYTVTAEVSEAGFKASSANLYFDQSLTTGVPAEVADNSTRGAYFDGRYVFYASRKNGNHVYYYDTQDPTKAQKSLKLTDGVFSADGTTWAISDVRVADNGKIYACAMANAKDKIFRVYRWDNLDAEAVKVLEYTVGSAVAPSTAVRLGDALSIIGDPSTNGYIITSNFPFQNVNQGQIYIWKYVNGVAQAVVVKDLVGKYEAPSAADKSLGQYARVTGIPGTNQYVLKGSASGIVVLDSNFDFDFELKRDTPVQGRAMDVNFFEYNGVRYMSYTVNREWAANDAFVEVVALTDGNNFVDGLKALSTKSMDNIRVYKRQITQTATAGAAWVVATSKAKVVNDKVRIFGYVCEYGSIAIEFSK